MTSVNMEYCDAFLSNDANFWMRVEHCGRYIWACDFLGDHGVRDVLDAACATGYGTNLLAAQGFRAFGIDRNPKCIDIANSHYSSNGAEYYVFDLDEDNWHQSVNHFDAVICFETLEHVRFPKRLIIELHHALRKDGLLLLSVPNVAFERFDEFGNNRDPFHINTFNRDSLLELLENAGFCVEQELGQDICNRAIYANSHLLDEGISQESLDQLWAGVKNAEDMVLASRILGYPSCHAIAHSYSFVFACRKKSG